LGREGFNKEVRIKMVAMWGGKQVFEVKGEKKIKRFEKNNTY